MGQSWGDSARASLMPAHWGLTAIETIKRVKKYRQCAHVGFWDRAGVLSHVPKGRDEGGQWGGCWWVCAFRKRCVRARRENVWIISRRKSTQWRLCVELLDFAINRLMFDPFIRQEDDDAPGFLVGGPLYLTHFLSLSPSREPVIAKRADRTLISLNKYTKYLFLCTNLTLQEKTRAFFFEIKISHNTLTELVNQDLCLWRRFKRN